MAISLSLGSVFIPLQTKAGFLASVFGSEVSADTNTVKINQTIVNSQNMPLLEANTFSKERDIDENVDVNILSNSALVPTVSSLGGSTDTGGGDFAFDQVSVYVVRTGDTISQIAEMFGVSINTILSANDMKKGDKLVVGDTLFILPISGVEHTVAKGQTLKSIAKLYKVDVSDITFYNGIALDSTLAVGDKLMIPGADSMFDEGGDKPAPNLSSSVARDANYYATHPIQGLAGYFVNPLPTGRKTQGLHGPGHRGIDIGAPTGTPIYAAADGIVIIARTGWSGGYGNMAIIQHSNGTKTLYAHMSKLGTSTGAQVTQGQVIGYVGSTGRSTGPHLHFEVFNAKNPGADWSWKK